MKTEKAIIKLALRATINKDGTQSIVIRVQWKGKRADKTLPYAVMKKDWNPNTLQVRNSNHNAYIINKMINAEKAKAESIRDNLILNNQPYTAKDIVDGLNNISEYNSKVKTLKSTAQEYIAANRLSTKSKLQYRDGINSVLRFFDREDVDLTELTTDTVADYLDYLDNQDYKNGTKFTYAAKLHAILNYAVDMGYIAKLPFLNKGNNSLNKRWTTPPTPKALTLAQVELLYRYWLIKGENPKWKDNIENYIYSKDFMLNFFLCGLNLQGLAPKDMCLLNKDMIRQNNSDKIVFATTRAKTKKQVIVTLHKNKYKMMFDCYVNRIDNGSYYLFPVMENNFDNWLVNANKTLKIVWKEFNQWLANETAVKPIEIAYQYKGSEMQETITKDNLEDYYIDVDKITLYSYRHTYASMWVANNGDIFQLAKDMGRSIANIETYLESLVVSQDVIDNNRLAILNQQ
ncbi:MAG: phage integrase SAM-like domain-containing protein [Prevotella sp.]|jgi:integrase